MQQYRVNYSLLIGLLVGSVVCAAAVYGVWLFQIDRNADALLSDAAKAIEEGDYRQAVQYYANYVSVRRDNVDGRIKYANALADLAQQDDAAPEERGAALNVLEDTVREYPETTELRRRLAEYCFELRQYQDALAHVDLLIKGDPDDVELKVLRAQYLTAARDTEKAIDQSYKIIGYDPETDTFDASKALAPDEVNIYTGLAAMLRPLPNKEKLADRVMEQLIAANPDSAAAHLRYGQYLVSTEREEEGEAETAKASELAPDDADVLYITGNLAWQKEDEEERDYEKAQELLEKGRELHPDDIRFYQSLAALATAQQDYDKALAAVNEGLDAVAGTKALYLLQLKSDLQAQARDIEGMRETIDEMRKAGFPSERIDWTEARMLLVQEKWFEASEALNRLRPRVERFLDLGAQIDAQLGLCYERLGQYELARDQYNLVLQNYPQNAPAAAGLRRVELRLGKPATNDKVAGEAGWQTTLREELRKPGDERDWASINEAIDAAEQSGELEGISLVLLKANLKMAQEDFAEARKLLRDANRMDPDNIDAYRLLVQTARLDPQQGPEKALQMVDKVIEKFGDQPNLRFDKADLCIAINGDDLDEQLSQLAEAPEDWSDNDKATLWSGMAGRYINLGMVDQAALCWNRVADIRPNDLPTRLTLFNLALETNDDAGIEAAQDKILDIVKDKQDSTWQYTEARRLLSLVRRGKLPTEGTIDQIRELVDRALDQRPDWPELNQVQAQLDLLEGNPEKALADFERAQDVGRLPPSATAQHIRLLVQRGRYQRAKQLLSRLPAASRQRLLGQTYSEILLRTNDPDAAVEQARAIVEASPGNSQNLLWYGQLLGRASQLPGISDDQKAEYLKTATEAVRQAVQLEPQLADAWYMLLSYYLIQDDREQAMEVLRDAQLTLASDLLPRFLAKSYDVLGYWFDAENMYRLQYDNDPDSTVLAKQLAAFYLGRVYQLQDGAEKATPLINQILRAGAEGKIPTDDPDLQWARRQGAELLVAQNDYQQLLKAEKLLASNFQNGFLSAQDQLQMAHLLASRPEPASRLKATQLFEAVAAEQSLDLASSLTLGRMYFALGDWAKCRTQMLKTISQFPDATAPRDAYVRMLLSRGDRGDLTAALTQVRRLQELAPGHPRVIALSVRVQSKLGREREANRELRELMQRYMSGNTITEQDIPALENLANLLADVGNLDDAERIYRALASRDANHALALAVFLGKHRDVEQSFQQLQSMYTPELCRPIIQAASTVVNGRRDEVGDKYDAQIQSWLDSALRENPDSIAVLLLQSDLYEMEQDYDAAADIYRRLLSRNDLTGLRRAVVLNNLSFLTALSGGDSAGADALELVQEAAQIMGPTTDILDTRAVAYIASGDYDKAVADMELSVLDNPTPSKYFHQALALMLAGQKRAAVDAWEKMESSAEAEAEDLASPRDALNHIEYDRYDDLKAQIDQLRNSPSL